MRGREMMLGGATGRLRPRAPHSWFLCLTIAGCLAAVVIPSSASAAQTWLRPVNVSRPEPFAVDTLNVIAGPRGNAPAVWQLYGSESGIVRSAVRRAGGSWSASHNL